MCIAESAYGCSSSPNLLHNSGGPRSRQVSEAVRSSMLSQTMLSEPEISISLTVPDDVDDPEAWLLGLAVAAGLRNWEDIDACISLPSYPMLVFSTDEAHHLEQEPEDILFRALVLAKCNEHRYIPDSPPIFTRKRLCRNITLKKINATNFYELD